MGGDVYLTNFRSDLGDSLVATDGVIEEIGRDVVKPTGHEVLDLDGAALLPGFIDAHTHVQAWGLRLFTTDLSGARSWSDIISRISGSDGAFIGIDYDESGWSDDMRTMDLDGFDFPVALRRVCGHEALANDAALRIMGEDHPGAVDDDGVSEKGALELFRIFDPGAEKRVEAARHGADTAVSLGITTVHEITHDLEPLRRSGTPLKWRAYMVIEDDPVRRRDGFAGIKLFSDGSIGSRTAWMTEDYTDGGRGGPYMDREIIIEHAGRAADLGLQVMAHALGDAAVHNVIEAYTEVAASYELVRPRIEHLELVPDGDWAAMRGLGVVVSMQPNFTVNWGMPGGMYETALGSRYTAANNYRKGLSCNLAFGSDCMPMGPLLGMRGALEHPDPDARLTVDEAVRAYTEGGARAGMTERSTGTIGPGKACDLVVLSGAVPDRHVLMTIIDGEVVFPGEG